MTRKTARKALVALFVTDGSFTGGVLAYRPDTLDGMTKVLAVYTTRTRYKMESKHLNHSFYTFALDVFVKRTSGEAHEDTFDDLHEVIRAVVRANVSNANWDNLDLDTAPSVASHVEDEGVPYRLERHSLLVKELRT